MITMTRTGLLLTLSTDTIPAQGSSDVPISFVNDPETYAGYTIQPLVGWYKNGCKQSAVCRYADDAITVPAAAFQHGGEIILALALIDPSDANHIETTQPASAYVVPAPNDPTELPDEDTWQTAVENFTNQLFDNYTTSTVQPVLTEAQQAVTTANTASDNANQAVETANTASENVQTAYSNLGNYKVENGILYFMKADGTYNEQGITLAGQSTVTDANNNPIITAPLTAPQNLLINGDFKINQRGQSSYSANDSLIYTIDNWAITNGSLSISNQIVTLTANVLTYDCWLWQFIDKSVFNSDNATCLIKLSDGIHVQQLQINQSGDTQEYFLNSKTKIHFKWDSKRNKYRFVIYVLNGNSESIDYICLYNGQIAYPHVVEDDAIALNRCLFEGLEIFNYYIGECHNVENKVQIIFKILPKKSTPTIKFNGNLCFLAKRPSEGWEYNDHSQNDVSIEVKKDTVIITSNKITQDLDSYLYGYFESAYSSYLEVTCEPL